MNTTTNIAIANLHPFEGHPYQVRDDAEMDALVESVRELGILTPLIVRPLEDAPNEYEVISGHRRLRAAQKAGIVEVPAFVHAVSREEAAIQLVDSNLHREHILPSEKAFAYKMKFDALKHQGRTSGQLGPKLTVDAISEEDSGRQVKRYIRLTHLIPPLLTLMDEGRIAFSVGVELSYLSQHEQRAVADAIELYDCTPSYSQACRMRKESEMLYAGDTAKIVASVLSEPKPNQREQIRLRRDDFRSYFPADYTDKQIKEDIIAGLNLLKKQRYRDRDTR
ncbi:MAG: ParB/RepB/Spo0J family partition protein [Oscillospiraceae bacterium]|nr:ParB/RepB/Spo0J family partition protein [Oscillospiraceae bacterium]MBQ9046179.1 ParB/RepB/Spo0J family partition protein [Oscillospiraceae bacterium]